MLSFSLTPSLQCCEAQLWIVIVSSLLHSCIYNNDVQGPNGSIFLTPNLKSHYNAFMFSDV